MESNRMPRLLSPLLSPNRIFLQERDSINDWSATENHEPNSIPFPLDEFSEIRKPRKSLIPVLSPPVVKDRRSSGVMSVGSGRSLKVRRLSTQSDTSFITPMAPSQPSTGRKSLFYHRDSLTSKQNDELMSLRLRVQSLEESNACLEAKIHQQNEQLFAKDHSMQMLAEELDSFRFFAALQGQKIEEQDLALTTSKFDQSDRLAAKNRKYKALIRKMQAEKESYEKGANAIITQLNSQMEMLNTFALGRIENLEKQLKETRKTNDELSASLAEQQQSNTRARSPIPPSLLLRPGSSAVAATAAASSIAVGKIMVEPDSPSSVHSEESDDNGSNGTAVSSPL